MRHLLIMLLMLTGLLPSTNAQKIRGVNSFCRKFENDKGAYHIELPAFLSKFGTVFIKDKTARRMIRKTGRVKIFASENNPRITTEDVNQLIRKLKTSDHCESLLEVRSGSTQVHILVRDKRKAIKRLIFVVRDESDFFLVNVKGRFKYKDIGKLIEKYGSKAKEKAIVKDKMPAIRA